MAGRRLQRTQGGAALLIFLVLLVMGGLTYLVGSFSPEAIEARRAQATNAALAQAREALTGYALQYRDAEASQGRPNRMYGYLPLPDLGSSRNTNVACTQEGCDANTFTGLTFDTNGIGPTVVGRFPWRTLGTGPLRDGHGECLWLIVSSLHSRIQRNSPAPILPPMNWDTLGQLDVVVANGANALVSALSSAHERPVAIIFSPGSPLPGQDRINSPSDDVSQCGGNYNLANYLDPATASALGGVTNYLADTNLASGATGDSDPANDPDTPKSLVARGKIFSTGSAFLPGGCQGSNCTLVANDIGLPVTSDYLFGAIRKNAHFRIDINSMLDRMVGCLRDQIAAGSSFTPAPITGYTAPADKSAGRIQTASCYNDNLNPLGYFSHYREMIFVAKPTAGNFTVAGDPNCAGVLLFSGQRNATQQRITATQKNTLANYLEGNNLTSFTSAGSTFSGDLLLDRSPPQSAEQDIARCIPVGASLNQVASPALNALGGQLTFYDPATSTLTLGRLFSITPIQRLINARAFFGCSWMPETRLLGSGLRSYFKFRILDTGEGFSFAIIDGDRNGANVCGAAGQHLGYSGNNGVTPPIAHPKISIEIDTTRQGTNFNPAALSTLSNGRADPSYTGGHFGIVYWGGESPINTGRACPCLAPRYCNAGRCFLPPEEDDNVHGLPTPTDPPPPRSPPRNPPAPATPTLGSGVYKLDPSLSQIPVNQNIHVRVELTRSGTDSTVGSNAYLLEVWLLKHSDTDADRITAMINTTDPMSLAAPGFTAHLRDTPVIYDIQGSSCAGGIPCPSGQTCGADNVCYAPALKKVRLGFTTSQSTVANDQIINISDFFTTWIP
ncbi:MAG: hypothetical protein Q7U85_02540 [Rhodocyclaceae bacterium]|nr:hypothetical protein [Rhodocyclaceae bacterium]